MGILCVICIYDTIGNGCKHRFQKYSINFIVRGDWDSRAILMPIYGDLYQIKL